MIMKTWWTLPIAAVLAAAAPMVYANTTSQEQGNVKPYYYWLHPKLGMVKVDRKTHFMLVGKRAASAEGTSPSR